MITTTSIINILFIALAIAILGWGAYNMFRNFSRQRKQQEEIDNIKFKKYLKKLEEDEEE